MTAWYSSECIIVFKNRFLLKALKFVPCFYFKKSTIGFCLLMPAEIIEDFKPFTMKLLVSHKYN